MTSDGDTRGGSCWLYAGRMRRIAPLVLVASCAWAATAEAETKTSRNPAERNFRLGLSLLGGATLPVNAKDWIGYGAVGLDFMARAGEIGVGVSLNGLNIGSTGALPGEKDGFLFQISFTPTIELSTFFARRVQGFVQIGVLTQLDAATPYHPLLLGASPMSLGGARFFITNGLSIAPALGTYVVATETAWIGSVTLGRGTVAPFGMLAAAVHF